MRTASFLFLFFVEALSSEPSFCPAWTLVSPVQSKCPLIRNGTSNLEELISAELAGQELATRAIRKALAKFFREYDEAALNIGVKEVVLGFPYSLDILMTNPIAQGNVAGTGSSKPLFMHFSGPTGVGKSLCTDIIARSMFSGINAARKRCGHVYFMLTEYSSATPRDFPEIQQTINATLVEQLKSCPRSLIVFDEVQNVAEDLLDGVLEIFYGRRAVWAGHAVVVMVSDLGHTRLQPGMTRAQATDAIQAAARHNFLRVNKHVLLDNIVPFLPLDHHDLQLVAHLELTKLHTVLAREFRGLWAGRLTWTKQISAWIASSCLNGAYAAEGGRGVQSYIQHEVMSLAEEQLTEECGQKSSGVSYNNLDLRLYAEEGPLVAYIDTVFGEDEF